MRVVLVFAVLGLICPWTEAAASLSFRQKERIHSAVFQFKKDFGLPSLVVSASKNQENVFSEALGVTDLSSGTKAKTDSVYRIASISKMITAVATLMAWQENRLSLEDKVSSYLSEVLPSPHAHLDEIRISDLLRHQSGIRHYHYELGEKVSIQRKLSLSESINPFGVLTEPLLFPPGTKFLYSTYGYNLLGAVLAEVSGEEVTEVLLHQIFSKLGMNQTGMDHPTEGLKLDATPYVRSKVLSKGQGELNTESEGSEIVKAPFTDVRWKVAGGGLASSVIDLNLFAQGLMHDELLSKEAFNQFTERTRIGSLQLDYANGVHVWDAQDGTLWLGHGGGATGGAAYLLFNPSHEFSIALLTNLQIHSYELRDLARHITKLMDLPGFTP